MEARLSLTWHNFVDKKPDNEGDYLIAYNNWDSYNIENIPLHNFMVLSAHWNGMEFIVNGNGYRNPDQWADLPFPPPAPRPAYYEESVRKAKDLKRKKLLFELSKLDSEFV